MIVVNKIKTDRLVLKKISKKDLQDYIEWKSQQSYHEYLPSNPKNEKEYKKTLNSILKGYKDTENPTLLWGVFLNQKLIGSVSIEDWNYTHKWCEIGWGLNPKYQKQGYALESVKCLINHIFNNLDMNRVCISIWDGNSSSKKLAEKLGFVQEGIERNARIKNNKSIDLYCYGLLKQEWNSKVQ